MFSYQNEILALCLRLSFFFYLFLLFFFYIYTVFKINFDLPGDPDSDAGSYDQSRIVEKSSVELSDAVAYAKRATAPLLARHVHLVAKFPHGWVVLVVNNFKVLFTRKY